VKLISCEDCFASELKANILLVRPIQFCSNLIVSHKRQKILLTQKDADQTAQEFSMAGGVGAF
jgi:hypothetical protein